MPDAHILASQRAEEAAREDEIKRLRADESAEKDQEIAVGLLRRADSSGSEGEGVLAATLIALRVAPAPTVHPTIHPSDVLLQLTSIMPSLGANTFYELSEYLRSAEPQLLEDILDFVSIQMVHASVLQNLLL